jgi:hypothetical protein
MKRSIALSIALAVSLISLSFFNYESTVRAQKQNKVTADSGVVTLGPNQILRLTVVNSGKADSKVSFRRMGYGQVACNGGVCKHEILNEQGTAVITLSPGEAASMDIANTSLGVRGVAFMDYVDDVCLFQIIDTTTGNVASTLASPQGGSERAG